MATGPASLVICCIALCILCMTNLTWGQCVAKFDFLGVNHTTTITTPTTSNLTTTTTTSNITLIIQKGSSLNVQFSMVTEDCLNDTDNHPNFTIKVRKRKKSSGYEPFCKIQLNANGTDSSVRRNECGSDDGGKGNFFLRKADLKSADETTWRLNAVSEDRKLEANATINLVVVYPPKVTVLKFQCGKREDGSSQPWEPGTQLNISCTYDAGQPPVSKAALTIAYGTEKVAGDKLEMKPRKKGQKKGTYKYRYKYSVEEVKCEDAGTVSCSVAGASKNKSQTLLVKCPPRILGNRSRRFEGKVSQPLELLFPVYSYTASFKACTLTSKRQQAYAEDEGDVGKVVGDENCSQPDSSKVLENTTVVKQQATRGPTTQAKICGEFSVLGTPPNLTLKLILHNLTDTDVGQKLLNVSNDAGSDGVEFDLQILDNKPTPSTGNPGVPGIVVERETKAALIAGIVIGAIAFLILTSIAIIAVLVKRKCSDTTHANEDHHHPLPPSSLPPPAAGAKDPDLSPLSRKLPSKTATADQCTGNTFQSPVPLKKRMPNDKLPELPLY